MNVRVTENRKRLENETNIYSLSLPVIYTLISHLLQNIKKLGEDEKQKIYFLECIHAYTRRRIKKEEIKLQ